jgi:hypothetical protein
VSRPIESPAADTAPRARVDLVLAWTVAGGKGRAYRNRFGAYYQIAKQLVLAKYPPGLTDYNGPDELDRVRMRVTTAIFNARIAKASALFCDDFDGHFVEKKFKRFVQRVAKFLMFVDDRRFRSHLHEQYENAIQSAAAGADAYRYRKDDPR